MKRYKEAVDELRAPEELREAIAALPQEQRSAYKSPHRRRIGLIAAALAVVVAVGAIGVPLFSVASRKAGSAEMASYDSYEPEYEYKSAYAGVLSDSVNGAPGDYAASEAVSDRGDLAFTSATSAGKSTSVALPADRKLIRDAQLDVETKTYDSFMEALNQKLAALQGYVASSDSSTRYDGNRYSTLTLRVPAASLDDFLSHISETATVTSQNTSVQDVTDDYIDIESRIKALETEQDTLLELMKKASKLTDVLEIQDRLSEVRGTLESYKGRLKALDSKISYSTVTLCVEEVRRETPPEGKTFLEQVRSNLAENLYSIGQGFRSFGIVFLSGLPYIFLWLCGIGIVVLIVVLVRRRRRKRFK